MRWETVTCIIVFVLLALSLTLAVTEKYISKGDLFFIATVAMIVIVGQILCSIGLIV